MWLSKMGKAVVWMKLPQYGNPSVIAWLKCTFNAIRLLEFIHPCLKSGTVNPVRGRNPSNINSIQVS